jgi:hypothetical protein
MRIYDPRLGRFLSVDPLTKNYPWNSPYSFAEGDPINFIDLDGAERADPPYKVNNVHFVQMFQPWVSPLLRKDGKTFTQTAFEANTSSRTEFTINAQQYQANGFSNPLAAGDNSNWLAQGQTIYLKKIVTGRSSPETFYASTNDGKPSFGQGDVPADADFGVGGGIPVLIDGLKYGSKNIYKKGAPAGLPMVGDPGEGNRKFLDQRSNAGYPKQDNRTVGKSILAYNSKAKSTMIIVQENGVEGMTLTEIRDRLISLGYDNAISFDGSNSATLVKDDKIIVNPARIKNNTIPSGITFGVKP